MPHVEFRKVVKTYPDGTRAVSDLDLVVQDREFLCILGPSGCGKSSTLRMLAGLETVSGGDLLLDGVRINDVPPQDRDMAMVFENYALYPHLRVFDNIAMPLVARGRPRTEIRERVGQVAETLRIADLLTNRPYTLSGGQRQRVALGRAIVRTPKMFLMDEPLGHLEAYLRVQLRAEVRRLHERLGTTTVYITHDQEEAAAVSDRIAVMNEGRLQQDGSLLDLLDRPFNRFVAEFVGNLPINILPATLTEATLKIGPAELAVSPAGVARLRPEAAGLHIGIRPEDVSLANGDGAGTIDGRVSVIEPQGDTTVLIAETSVGPISAVAPSTQVHAPGEAVRLQLSPERTHVFAASGVALIHGLDLGV